MALSLLPKGLAGLFFWATLGAASSQASEITPPSGKGPVVVVASGAAGDAAYYDQAKQIADLGYDVVLVDGNEIRRSRGQALRDAIAQGRASPHGAPGKVGVVGYSLGGGAALALATRWSDEVAGVVAFYPVTREISDPKSFVTGIKVPVLMLAGEADTYRDCCLIETARALARAADAAHAPLQLVTYPGASHDFVRSAHYDVQAASDSFRRMRAKLAQYLGR